MEGKMSAIKTFYLSRVLGSRIYSPELDVIGKLEDIIVDISYERPKIVALKLKTEKGHEEFDSGPFDLIKRRGKYYLVCKELKPINLSKINHVYLAKQILDRQIVDVNGRKVVRVNDLRFAMIPSGTFLVAVDVGIEGLLRRLGLAKPLKFLLKPFGLSIPSKFMPWDEVEHINLPNLSIKISSPYSKLLTLHPSDIADIIEELDRNSQIDFMNTIDEEKAADVFEELEQDVQISLLENLPVQKAADVLEKMPADEAADILDDLDKEKAEELLNEMEKEASDEVRELMEYPDNTVGSLMTTDFIAFKKEMTVQQTIDELRKLKPESDSIYYLYVLDNDEKLLGTVSLRDLIVSDPDIKLVDIMNQRVIKMQDYDKIDDLAEIISKYNLLAIPVVDNYSRLLGMILIDDVVFTLLKSRKRKL
jgi:CBS domain-containing protein/sporulation protein YlmC with PRC-barrel domain